MERIMRGVLSGLMLSWSLGVPSGAFAQTMTVTPTTNESAVFTEAEAPPMTFSFRRDFQKVRCTSCGMEFFWQWNEARSESTPDMESQQAEVMLDQQPVAQLETRPRRGPQPRMRTRPVTPEPRRAMPVDDPALATLEPQQEMFEKDPESPGTWVTCPYDGFHFNLEESPTDQLITGSEVDEKLSSIEATFTKVIPQSISRDLEQFGYDVFTRVAPSEAPATGTEQDESEFTNVMKALGSAAQVNMPASLDQFVADEPATVPISADYVVGPGDKLIINLWGNIQLTFPVTVDREGKLILPKAGPVYVWGLRFDEVEQLIAERLKQHFTNFQVDVSMGKLRNIRIFVLGEVDRPGAHILSSQSTVFHALYAAGGPSKLGSLRKIKLLRTGDSDREIDLYRLLIKGDKTQEYRLQSDDTIYVPPIGDVVAIAGAVKRPAIYETRSEILLSELLGISGGLTPVGNPQRLQLERVEDGERRVVLDLTVDEQVPFEDFAKTVSLRNGDVVLLSSIARLKHNFVTVLGSVEYPGHYELQPGMRVSDLIDQARGLMPGTHLDRAELARVGDGRTRELRALDLRKVLRGEERQDQLLSEWDVLLVYAEPDVAPVDFVEVDGAVQWPGRYEFSEGMNVGDLLFHAGGAKRTADRSRVELFRLVPGSQPKLLQLDLTEQDDIRLLADDQLFVREEARWVRQRVVELRGEVRYPGKYALTQGESISSVLQRAGGFTDQAFLSGAVFTRQSIQKAQERTRQRLLAVERQRLSEEEAALAVRPLGTDAGQPIKAQILASRRAALEELSLRPVEGRMVVYLAEPSVLANSKDDILMEGGDVLVVPQTPSSVSVVGSVHNATSIRYEPGMGVDFYVNRVGGTTRFADTKSIYVVRANGESIGRFSRVTELLPGDTVVVPQKYASASPRMFMNDSIDAMTDLLVGIGVLVALGNN